MEKRKVLHLLSTNKFSGAENVVCQIIDLFRDDDNYELIYCSPRGQITEALTDRKILYEPIESFSINNIKRALSAVKPDIIHAHDMRATFYASIAASRIPIVSHIHNNSFNSRKISLKSILFSYAAHRTEHIFWVSRASFLGYYYHKKFSKKSSILYNVIDRKSLITRAEEDHNHYNYDVVFLGRLTYPKNPQRLIYILSQLISVNPNVRVAIIGDGDLKDEVITLINKYGINNEVNYLGFLNNPYKLLSESKVMIMTSRWEGLPMCALESMSLGVPLVATPVDGLKEIIRNDVEGYLTDENSQIVNTINKIIVNKNYQQTLSSNCIKRMEEIMDLNKYKAQVKEVYNNCF